MASTDEHRLESRLRRRLLRIDGLCINGMRHPPPIGVRCIPCIASHRGCTVAEVRADLMRRELSKIGAA